MTKVRWGAKHDYEFVENYKVLQQAFAKNDIKKHIDVDKLVKAKYQDNLEFLQWLKRYFDLNFSGAEYDAAGRRKGQDLFYILGGGKVGGQAKGAPPKSFGKPTAASSKPSAPARSAAPTAAKSSSVAAGAKAGVDSEQLKAVQAELQEAKLNMDTLEKERDFYFGKLRDIELFLQTNQSQTTELTENVLKILYASEEEQVQVGEDGSLSIVPTASDAMEEAN